MLKNKCCCYFCNFAKINNYFCKFAKINNVCIVLWYSVAFVAVLADQAFAAAEMVTIEATETHKPGDMMMHDSTLMMMLNEYLPTSNNHFQRSYLLSRSLLTCNY